MSFGDLAWNHNTNTLVVFDRTGNPLRTVDADTGVNIHSTLTAVTFGQITSGNDNVMYIIDNNIITASVSSVNLQNGDVSNTFNVIPTPSIITDLGEWINQPAIIPGP